MLALGVLGYVDPAFDIDDGFQLRIDVASDVGIDVLFHVRIR